MVESLNKHDQADASQGRRGPAGSPTRVTRLAPSPTGALHLGNARTFLINWAMARQGGWRIVLRMEDLDGPRIKAQAAAQAIDVLTWLGMQWDQGPVYQTADLAPYRAALQTLRRQGRVYPCTCSRKEIEQAQSAPHAEDHEARYPGTCRGRAVDGSAADQAVAWRVVIPQGPIEFEDGFHGRQRFDVQAQVGDFLVATKAGLPAYQLAVVVDDARQGVTDVIRGDDLLSSTARQLWLYRLLGLSGPNRPPRFTHLPLVIGADGRRLAKRHGDTRVATYRQRGTAAQRIIGLLAYWSGVFDRRTECTAEQFAQGFALHRLPRDPVVFTPEDHAWLLA